MSGAPSSFRAARYLDNNGISGGAATAEDVNITYDDSPTLVSEEAERSLLRQLDSADPGILKFTKEKVHKYSSK